MDRMLIGALVLWVAVLSLFKIGSVVSAIEPGPSGRVPACFPHDRHMEAVESCNACHHRYENGENVMDEAELDGGDAMRCNTCHTDTASLDSRQAFHRMCIQCHRNLDKQGMETGPRTCGTCHPKSVSGDVELLLIKRMAGS